MHREYSIVSPSLEGLLSHENLMYEGIDKPTQIMRVMERVGVDMNKKPHEQKILEQYFFDLYGVFMKKFSSFVLDGQVINAETLRLQAMLQEMIKVKKIVAKK